MMRKHRLYCWFLGWMSSLWLSAAHKSSQIWPLTLECFVGNLHLQSGFKWTSATRRNDCTLHCEQIKSRTGKRISRIQKWTQSEMFLEKNFLSNTLSLSGVFFGRRDNWWDQGHHLSLANTVTKKNVRYKMSSHVTPLAPCVLYIRQAFRYSPENAFCIFNQQIYFIIW